MDTLKQRLRNFSLLFILLGLFQGSAMAAETDKACAVCGMKTSAIAKTGFESEKDGKPIYFCSFACAHRFRESKAFRDAPLFAHDFRSGIRTDASAAYFLIKSSQINKEVDFDMPPTVVAFSAEAEAKETLERLKDGQVVKGIGAVEKAYGK